MTTVDDCILAIDVDDNDDDNNNDYDYYYLSFDDIAIHLTMMMRVVMMTMITTRADKDNGANADGIADCHNYYAHSCDGESVNDDA
jgi:hypothetical protein